MLMSTRLACADKYEAKKLASMALVKDAGTYIHSILNVIDNEVVITLHDHSAHSILMSDRHQAEELASYMQSVMDGTHRITSATVDGMVISLSKSAPQ